MAADKQAASIPGGRNGEYNHIRTLDDVPAHYKSDSRFEALATDPAHGYDHIVPGGLREAMAALEAEKLGKVKGPIKRPDNPYVDLYDADGCPFDIKAPPSPPSGARYPFDWYAAGESVLKQLRKNEPNAKTGKEEPVRVLLDTTYMIKEDYQALTKHIKENAQQGELDRIVAVSSRIPDRKHERENSNQSGNPKKKNKGNKQHKLVLQNIRTNQR